MIDRGGTSHPAGFLAGWTRWAALAVFAVMIVIGVLPLHPSALAAGIAAAVAVGAGAPLIWQRCRCWRTPR